MPIHQYVHCPNAECEFHLRPILLPDSNPPQTDLGQASWSMDGTELYIACPGCRQVSVHYEANAFDFLPEAQSDFRKDKVWLRITYLCAVPLCTTPTEFYVLTEMTAITNIWNRINDKFQIGYWNGVTACGHKIQKPHNFHFDLVKDAMCRHDPRHDDRVH